MTIFRCSALAVAPVLTMISVTGVAGAERTDHIGECGNISPSVQRQCISHRIEAKQRQMDQLIERSRAILVRRFERTRDVDLRGDPSFLDQAQRAWRSYVEANWTVIAAYPGGGNAHISDRIAYCYEDKLDRRLTFLRNLVEGRGEFGL